METAPRHFFIGFTNLQKWMNQLYERELKSVNTEPIYCTAMALNFSQNHSSRHTNEGWSDAKRLRKIGHTIY